MIRTGIEPTVRRDHRSSPRHWSLRRTVLALGLVAGSAALAVPVAHAAYGGVITRTVCMAGAMVPRNSDRNNWSNDTNTTCSAKVVDTSATAFHWARVSIPFEGAGSVTGSVRVKAGASGNGEVCTQMWTVNSTGGLSGGSGSTCSSGTFGFQTLSRSATLIGTGGAVLMDIAAQNNGEAHLVSLHWTVSGT